ncbi:primosomal protein N' [Nocardia miyunensis]|uniref:primosomal protein N' n=1 Tax=Nocardia miyunensis TaxID=282684 RepID=UPI001FE230AC|nr:primosomal protein N' [Nocardia miyunensis]
MLEPAHLDRDFDYLVPPEMDELAQPGVRVRIRFSGRLVDGYLLERLEHSDHTGTLMRLERVVSGERVLTPEILRLITAVAARYAGTRADVLRLAIPPRHARTEAGPANPKLARNTPKSRAEAFSDATVAADPTVALGTSDPEPTFPNIPSADTASPEPRAAMVSGTADPSDSSSVDDKVANRDAGETAANPGADAASNARLTSAPDRPLIVSTEKHADAGLDDMPDAGGRDDIADRAGRAGADTAGTDRAGEYVVTDEKSHIEFGSTTDSSMIESAGERLDTERGDRAGGGDGDVRASAGDVDDPVSESGAGVDVRPDSAAAVDISRYSEWSRYRHGASFLGALAAGKGPRAAWQALPGEDWARRLAELAAVVAGGGRGVVVMVPDQRDLDRVLAACAELVGEAAVGLAAGLGPSARYRRWLAALRGTARIVVGTRSSVFAPVHDLGLVVIWDDGDDTYAEPRSPYPHAREVAMLRVHETGAAFLAGGFARTAEIQAVVASGWAHDLVADRAVVRQYAPRISAPGDSDVALERDPVARAVRIPAVAFTAARKALAAGDPVLVQVPRRGYVPALSCARCRTPARCRHCNGPLALPAEPAVPRPAGDAARPGSARELGVALSRSRSGEVAHSPQCRWCGRTDAAFRCGACGARALRAVVIGAARTAEELGRAFPGVPIRGSGGATVLDSISEGPQVVVSTIGAEPSAPGGYGVALLLDGWALLGRADLRAAEDALRRWMSAAALVRPTGQVIVMAEPSVPTVQALVRWDPVTHAEFELAARAEVRFPPAVRLAALDGTTDSIAELLGETKLPAGVEVLGPVPLPPGARTPFSAGDAPPEIERMILRADRAQAATLSHALSAALAVRSTRRSGDPLRVQIDPIDIG